MHTILALFPIVEIRSFLLHFNSWGHIIPTLGFRYPSADANLPWVASEEIATVLVTQLLAVC